MLGTILIIILILVLIGGLPVFPYSANWGYGPAGWVGFVLLIVILLVAFGRF